MSNLTVSSFTELAGIVDIPGDKSITHRAFMLASLFNKGCKIVIRNFLDSLDCRATLTILGKLGLSWEKIGKDLTLYSLGKNGLQEPTEPLDVGNSGTTIRLMTGILSAQKFSTIITGDRSICKRPMARIIHPLTMMGAKITADNNLAPLRIIGNQKLSPIDYTMPIASAQVKSAILLASLCSDNKSYINSHTICRNHTELMFDFFAANNYNRYLEIDIPGDISSSAFFIVAACIVPGSKLVLPNIGINPTRTGIITVLQQMGADITVENPRCLQNEWRADITVKYASRLEGIVISQNLMANIIDEIPIICLAAACAHGTTVIRGATELRYKESDRISMLAEGLTTLGITVATFADGISITGGSIGGGIIKTDGDHRIAMTFILSGLAAREKVIVKDTANIATSFPNFIEVARAIGIKMNEVTGF